MAPRDVVVVGYDGAELLDIACVTSAFRMANERSARPPYRITVASVDGEPIVADGGLTLGVTCALSEVLAADTVVVSGGNGHQHAARNATSGGVTASLDLTLALIEEDHGPELTRWVAMGMVTYLQRPGNQAQMSIFTDTPRPDDAAVRAAINYVVAHPDRDLRADALAAHVGISPRQLNRLFHDQLNEPPGAAVRRIRLEIAARLIATTDLPLEQVARRCGFGSAETLRQAFVARYGASPREFRTRNGAPRKPENAPRTLA